MNFLFPWEFDRANFDCNYTLTKVTVGLWSEPRFIKISAKPQQSLLMFLGVHPRRFWTILHH